MTKSIPNDSALSRRNFLGLAAAVPVLALAAGAANKSEDVNEPAGAETSAKKKIPIGLELYSVRNELGKDVPNTLKNVAAAGYDLVEFYSPYASWTVPKAKEYKSVMDDLGIRCFSTHNGMQSFVGDGVPKAIELNQILGVRHMILAAAAGNIRSSDGWKKLGATLTAVVEQLKPHGLTAGFHNHASEWTKLENGERAMDVLAASTPPEFVLQFDVGTCMEAMQDPVAWIKANPGRIKSMHLKEWAPGTRQEEKGYRTLFGEGVSPWKEITDAAESVGGVEYYLMEQEGSRFSEFETIKRCLDNWKAFRAKG